MAVFATYTTIVDHDAVGYDSGHQKVGQPFTVTGNCTVNSVDIYDLFKVGSPTGNFTLSIAADSGGIPGSVLETSSTVQNVASLPASAGTPKNFAFAGTTNLTAGPTYWLVYNYNGGDGSDFVRYAVGNSGIPYTTYDQFDGTTWTPKGSYDTDFTLNGTAAVASSSHLLGTLGVGT